MDANTSLIEASWKTTLARGGSPHKYFMISFIVQQLGSLLSNAITI